jgi:hypothetical protein
MQKRKRSEGIVSIKVSMLFMLRRGTLVDDHALAFSVRAAVWTLP